MKLIQALRHIISLAQTGINETVGHTDDPDDKIAIQTVEAMMDEDMWGFSHQFNFKAEGELIDYLHMGVDQFVVLVSVKNNYVVATYTEGSDQLGWSLKTQSPKKAVDMFFEQSKIRLLMRTAVVQGRQEEL